MEVTERKENPLLNRVEIHFVWNHANSPTPSLSEMRAAAARAEPGAKEELVFVKDVKTRFGMAQTTGMALVYGSVESAELESEYIKTRHSSESEAPAATPEPEPSEEEAEKASEDDGSEGGDE